LALLPDTHNPDKDGVKVFVSTFAVLACSCLAAFVSLPFAFGK